MDIPEFQSTYTAQTTIMRAKYLHCSEKLSICMGCHHGYGVIKVWRMLKSRDLFSHILCVGLVVVVLLWGRVSTTRELSVCGEMCIQGVLRLCLDHDLFNHLESQYLLDPANEVHIFCLHHVYVPCINRHLEEWRTAWLKHPMRSEHKHHLNNFGLVDSIPSLHQATSCLNS